MKQEFLDVNYSALSHSATPSSPTSVEIISGKNITLLPGLKPKTLGAQLITFQSET